MPTLDINIPQFKPEDLDDEKQRRRILGYLASLNEQLRYVLNNLDEDNLSPALTEVIDSKTSATEFNEATGRMETMSTQISQNAKEIALKASSETVDALGNRVGSAEASISTQAGWIALKANQTEVDNLTGRVSTAESSIDVQAGEIALKASQTEVDNLTGRVSTAESSITAQAGEIALKASRSEVNDLGDRLSTAESEIAQTPDKIAMSVNGIKIGGTNLLRLENPNNGYLYAEKRVDQALIGKTFYKSGTTLVLRRPPVGSSIINFWDTPLMGTPEKPGLYVLSFYAWSVGENGLNFYTDIYEWYDGDHYYYITDHAATSDVVRFELPFTYTAGQRNLQVRFHTNHVWGNPDAYICITDVKLEEGTKATDWSSNDEEFRAGSSLVMTREGIKMSGGELEMNAGTSFKVRSGGTVQIDTAIGANSYINLGDGNFSASKDGGVVANDGHFGAKLDVAGRRVLTLADLSHKIVVSSSDPGGTDIIWVKPFAMSSTSYTGYTASSRNETVDFARTNPIVRTFTTVDKSVLSGGEISYSLTVPLYSVGSSLDWFTLSGSLSKNGQTVQFTPVDCQIRPWKESTVTLTARSSINLCADVGGITVSLYGDRHGTGGNVYLQKETNMTLACTVETAGGMMDCAVKYIPIGLKHSELIAEPGTVLGNIGGRVFTTNVWGFCCNVISANGEYIGPALVSPNASGAPITTSDGYTITYEGQRGDGWFYTSLSVFMPTWVDRSSNYPVLNSITGAAYYNDAGAVANDIIRYYNREI